MSSETETETKLQILRAAIIDKRPYTSGVCPVPTEQCLLFYRKDLEETAL
jgi:hypothetical protein